MNTGSAKADRGLAELCKTRMCLNPVVQKEEAIMDTLEIMKPAPAPPTPEPASALALRPQASAPSPAVASCCSTATFPPDVVRSWLGNRRVLAVAGLALGGTGLALGWDWLTAVGIAPLIVATAPCLIMCALGMCMMGKASKAISNQSAPPMDGPSAQSKPPSVSEQ
jgi:hypothetical protein